MWVPISRIGWELLLSLGSPQGIRTSLHLGRWKMSLHLRYCRESRLSFESGHHGVHYTWGRKHRVTLTYLFLREGSSWGACGKLAYVFRRRQGIIIIRRRYGVPGYFIVLLYWNWCSYSLEMGFSGNLWIVVKDVKPLLVYDVEGEMSMDTIKGKCASSWVDLRYTNLFCILGVTSVFFSCCDSVLGNSLQFHQGNWGTLLLWLGTWNSSTWNAGVSGLIFQRVGSLMSILKLLQAPGVHSRVKAGMAIWNSGLFSDVMTPV